MATNFHGTAEAERLHAAIKSYVDSRLADHRLSLIALETTVREQDRKIKDLEFKAAVVDNRTRKLIPRSGEPVKL